jgi:hypothetical protein
VFAAGVHAAVSDLVERFPDTKIEIVYAGCGPFATLALPVLERFTPDQIKLTLIDIHDFSLAAAAKCIDGLGLSAHKIDYVLGDASTYQHPRDSHLVISETMQVRLITEMQTPITLNFAPQLVDGGIFVPERIEVEAALAYKTSQFELPEFESMTSLAVVSPELIRRGEHRPFGGSIRLPKSGSSATKASVAMRTKITVYRDYRLTDNESGLTMYLLLPDDRIEDAETVEFHFIDGEKPRWQIEYK